MDRLSIFLTLPIGAMLVGGLAILFLTFGWYGWAPLLAAFVIGGIASWPVSHAISKRIKRQDPDWKSPEDVKPEDRSLKPNTREI